jgi:hypothetical protein
MWVRVVRGIATVARVARSPCTVFGESRSVVVLIMSSVSLSLGAPKRIENVSKCQHVWGRCWGYDLKPVSNSVKKEMSSVTAAILLCVLERIGMQSDVSLIGRLTAARGVGYASNPVRFWIVFILNTQQTLCRKVGESRSDTVEDVFGKDHERLPTTSAQERGWPVSEWLLLRILEFSQWTLLRQINVNAATRTHHLTPADVGVHHEMSPWMAGVIIPRSLPMDGHAGALSFRDRKTARRFSYVRP